MVDGIYPGRGGQIACHHHPQRQAKAKDCQQRQGMPGRRRDAHPFEPCLTQTQPKSACLPQPGCQQQQNQHQDERLRKADACGRRPKKEDGDDRQAEGDAERKVLPTIQLALQLFGRSQGV